MECGTWGEAMSRHKDDTPKRLYFIGVARLYGESDALNGLSCLMPLQYVGDDALTDAWFDGYMSKRHEAKKGNHATP